MKSIVVLYPLCIQSECIIFTGCIDNSQWWVLIFILVTCANAYAVVDNPTHWESSYCLPLLVINFSTHKPSPLKSYPQHVQIHSDGSHSDGDCQQDLYEPGAYRSIPFRWYWRTDNGFVHALFLYSLPVCFACSGLY